MNQILSSYLPLFMGSRVTTSNQVTLSRNA